MANNANEQVALRAAPAAGAYDMIMRAVTDGACDPAKLRELLAVRREWEGDEARKAFAEDYAAFRASCPIIEPLDSGDKAKYAKLDRIERTIRPIEAKHGLSILWADVRLNDAGTLCHLRGMLCHRQGHSIPVAFDVPIPAAIISREGKEVGNLTQRVGGATSYGKRYGKLAIYDLVCGKDDDGACGVRDVPTLAQEDEARIRELCEELGRDSDAALKYAREHGAGKTLDALVAAKRKAGKA